MKENNYNPKNLPIIKTCRTEKEINEGAVKGFRPLVRKVERSEKIRSKYAILQHRSTGEIKVLGDFRYGFQDHEDYDIVIDWTWYYPEKFPEPFAAYMIPKDLEAGQEVWIDELIEDYVGSEWNQGDTARRKYTEALWTGNDLEIKLEAQDIEIWIG